MKRMLLLLAAASALAGCGQKSTPVDEAATATATTPPPPPAAAEATGTPTTADTKAELDKAATATQETAGSSAAPADSSLERMVAMPENAQLPGGRWKAGTHYRPIVPAQPTSVAAGEVEVLEFMWFLCSHCYDLNERVVAWEAKLPAWVKFRQEHVMWGPAHRSLGQLLYTLDALGRHDLVPAAFEQIHRRGKNLVAANPADTLTLQLAFAKANGISEADYKREYNGFTVRTRLQKAEELTRRYRIEHTPVFVVNGKYFTDEGMAGGGAQLTQLLNDLAAAEKR